MSRCQFVAVYPPMLNHIRMGKLAGWIPGGHHERVRESYMMNFVYYKRGNRDLPHRISAARKEVNYCHQQQQQQQQRKQRVGPPAELYDTSHPKTAFTSKIPRGFSEYN